MKYLFFFLSILLFFSCGTVHKYSETIPKNGFEKLTKVTRKNSKNSCIRIEQNITRDSATQVIQSKEIIKYNCVGSMEKIISCKKWKLENEKLVRLKTDCKAPKF